MQSKQSVALWVVYVTALVSVGSGVQGAEPSLDQWLFPWTPILEQQTVSVHGDPRDVGGVTLHTLRVTDGAGHPLFTYEGTELLSVAPLRVGPDGDETLLITQWTGGNKPNALV